MTSSHLVKNRHENKNKLMLRTESDIPQGCAKDRRDQCFVDRARCPQASIYEYDSGKTISDCRDNKHQRIPHQVAGNLESAGGPRTKCSNSQCSFNFMRRWHVILACPVSKEPRLVCINEDIQRQTSKECEPEEEKHIPSKTRKEQFDYHKRKQTKI